MVVVWVRFREIHHLGLAGLRGRGPGLRERGEGGG
jgi:hypothetical protein